MGVVFLINTWTLHFFLFLFLKYYNVEHSGILITFIQISFLTMGKTTTQVNCKDPKAAKSRKTITMKEKLEICKLYASNKSLAEIGRLSKGIVLQSQLLLSNLKKRFTGFPTSSSMLGLLMLQLLQKIEAQFWISLFSE